MGAYGWEEAFIITGALGFVWLIFWLIFYQIPEKQKRLGQAEFAYINSDQEPVTVELQTTPSVKWSALLGYRQTWVFIVGKFLTDPIWYFFLFWLPAYFNSIFQLDLSKPILPLVVVYSATTLGSIGAGLYTRGVKRPC